MRTNLEQMIDASVHCSKCGAKGVGTCDCWVTLRCPTCGASKLTERQPGDGPIVEAMCPRCMREVLR